MIEAGKTYRLRGGLSVRITVTDIEIITENGEPVDVKIHKVEK